MGSIGISITRPGALGGQIAAGVAGAGAGVPRGEALKAFRSALFAKSEASIDVLNPLNCAI